MKNVIYTMIFLSAVSASFGAGWFIQEHKYYSLLRYLGREQEKIMPYKKEDFSYQIKLNGGLELTVVEKNITGTKIEGIFRGDDKSYYRVTYDVETEKEKITPIESDKQTRTQNSGVF